MPESLKDRPSQARPNKRRPEQAPDQPIALELRHVTAHAPDGTTLLDDVSFRVRRGTTVAIVGPTGAGTTSLARALTGSLRVVDGAIALNGRLLGDELVHGRVAYVPQEDALHTDLSLRQALDHSAVLRLPTHTIDERAAEVDRSLRELGLETHETTMVRDLSVGQRKRASIAAQLLGDPDVIVLDEPTAGLDPGYERVVLNALRALSDGGRTIVIVSHSLATMTSCDRVVFLAAGGRVAFFGPPSQVTEYFETSDAADVFLALDTHDPVAFEQPVELSVVTDADDAADVTMDRGATPFWRQVAMLVRRDVDMLRADRRRLALLALQAPIVGALLVAVLPVGALHVTDHAPNSRSLVVVMFLVLSTMWPGVTNAIREVVKERLITRLEVASGLSARAYVASKVIFLGAITMVQAAVIAYVATGRQQIVGHGIVLPTRFELVAVAALVGLVACTLGIALSSITTTPDKALALLPTTLVVQLAFAGNWTTTSHVPLLHELRWVMGSRWGMEAMAGTLRGDSMQWRAAVMALSTLAVAGVLVAAVFVGRSTRSLAARTPAPRLNARVTPHNAGVAVAVIVSVAAAATGVLTLNSLHHPSASPRPVVASSPTVVDPTPTTAAPATTPAAVTAATTPPATETAPAKTVARRTTATAPANDQVQTTDESIPVADTTPDTTPTTAAPVTTPTTVKPKATTPWWVAYMNAYNNGGGQ